MKKIKLLRLFLTMIFILSIIFLLSSCSKNKNKNDANSNDFINSDTEYNNIQNNDNFNNDKIIWEEYDKTINISPSNDKLFMLFFYADWCPYCKKMEESTFTNKDVIEILNKNFISLKINSESKQVLSKIDKNITGITLAQSYQITGLPTVVFLDKNGKPLTAVPGFLPPDLFINILKYLYTESYKNQTFEEFQAKQK